MLSSLNLALFPLLYFFSFFYYTDVGSTFLVLLMYCLHLDGFNLSASFMGLVAVAFRQTNIIWVAFVAGQSVAEPLLINIHEHMIANHEPVQFHLKTMGQIKELIIGIWELLLDPLR